MIYPEALQAALLQSAADLGCSPEDFSREDNICVRFGRPEVRRACLSASPVVEIVSYGKNAVAAAASEELRETVQGMLDTAHPAWVCFQPSFTQKLAQILEQLPIRTYLALDTCFLPSEKIRYVPDGNFPAEFRLLEPSDFAGFYQPEWSNALSLQNPSADVLCAGAFVPGGRLGGLAGCSRECSSMWQIGVDVLEKYRGRGIASRLVRFLAGAVMEREITPYYTAASANIWSLRTAAAAGFSPAWVQITARRDLMRSPETNPDD